MLHKPRGVISSLSAQGNRQTVRDLVAVEGRLYPVGRLDSDSEGLILLTNDGELTDHLTHPRYESEKEYRVLVKGIPDDERLAAWRRGVILDGRRTAPASVIREQRTPAGTWLRVTMHEGRKHQIRDIGLLLGLPVRRLMRVRMGGLTLGNLAAGEWRELNSNEVQRLREPGREATQHDAPQKTARPSSTRTGGRAPKPASRGGAARTQRRRSQPDTGPTSRTTRTRKR
jgi:23S rRNA pseudouridine2605 synthase